MKRDDEDSDEEEDLEGELSISQKKSKGSGEKVRTIRHINGVLLLIIVYAPFIENLMIGLFGLHYRVFSPPGRLVNQVLLLQVRTDVNIIELLIIIEKKY